MDHLSTEEILSYIGDNPDQKNIFKIEAHLTQCEDCCARVNKLLYLKDHFDEIWDSWTAKTHAQELFKAHAIETLAAADVRPELRERAEAWIRQIGQKTYGILDIVFTASKKTAEIMLESLEGICQPALKFAPVTGPVCGPSLGDKNIVLEAAVPYRSKVTVDPATRRIVIISYIIQEPPPLVMLYPKSKGTALIQALKRYEETDYLSTEFKDIMDGEYLLMLEAPPADE